MSHSPALPAQHMTRVDATRNARACGRITGTEYSGVQTPYNAQRPLSGCTPGEGSLASRGTDEMARNYSSLELAALKALIEAESRLEMLGRNELAREIRVVRGRLLVKYVPK